MGIAIRGGRVIDPHNGRNEVTDLFVEGARIAAIGARPEGFTTSREVDASGQLVIPGCIDLHARLREPGYEHKATIASESLAAAAGGVTTLCCPPDTLPIIDNDAVAKLIRQRAEESGRAKVVPLGALTKGLQGELLSEMHSLQAEGCLAVSNGQRPVSNTLVMRRAMEYAATLGITVFLQSEDAWLRSGCMHEGVVSARLGLEGIPDYAEVIGVSRDLQLVEQTGVRAHFGQLSSARAVALIAEAQRRGLPVTADVAIHHLFLTEMDVGFFNSLCHVRPPLRTQRDRDGLRQALAEGVISAVCSDHQPHDADAKLAPFAATEPGASTLDLLLPLMLRLVNEGVLSLDAAIARLTSGPGRVLGNGSGTLTPGAPADLCVIDPAMSWGVTPSTLRSSGKNSPFLGWEVKGRSLLTLLNGRPVFELRTGQ